MLLMLPLSSSFLFVSLVAAAVVIVADPVVVVVVVVVGTFVLPSSLFCFLAAVAVSVMVAVIALCRTGPTVL